MSQADGTEDGIAGRVELLHRGKKSELRLYAGKSDNTFTNNAAILSSGKMENGFKFRQKLTEKTDLISEGIWTEENTGSFNRKGVYAGVESAFAQGYTAEFGVRYSNQDATRRSGNRSVKEILEVRSVRAKLTAPLPKVKNASIYGEYENDVVETSNRMFAVGLDYQVNDRAKVYGRHEFINSFGSVFSLNGSEERNATIFGIESNYMKNGQVYNEYRARNAFSGRQAETATGLRNQWALRDGLKAETSFEKITALSDNTDMESTSGTLSMEYTGDALSKITGRTEIRNSSRELGVLNTLGYARKINRDWSFLSRTIYYGRYGKGPSADDRNQARLQLGMAYRQTDVDKFSGLVRYELKYEDGPIFNSYDLTRLVHSWKGNIYYQPFSDWRVMYQYAGKLANESNAEFDSRYHAHLNSVKVNHEISRKWDIGVHASSMIDSHGQIRYGFGPEVGVTLKENVRLGFGYTFKGFEDRDIGTDYTRPGFFINFKIKLDESIVENWRD